MEEIRQFYERTFPIGIWLDTFASLIRHGISVIRKDGLAYFFKRLSQFVSWQVCTLYKKINFKLTSNKNSQVLIIKDFSNDQKKHLRSTVEFLAPLPELEKCESSSKDDIKFGQHHNLVRKGISVHNLYLDERSSLIRQAREQYLNRRVLFLAPIGVLSGGANLIILTARVMQRMGVDAQILNLKIHREWFTKNYTYIDIPVIFTDVANAPTYLRDFDAVIATSNPTVSWITEAAMMRPDLPVGYYIQDYEPYFYPQGSHEFKRAAASYTLLPHMVRMATTAWISNLIRRYHHVDSKIIGVHMDTDLFRPRPRNEPSWPDRPLRILSMIRPSTPRRNPEMTLSILRQISESYRTSVEIILFGSNPYELVSNPLVRNFPCKLVGQLRPTQMANLLNDADIFIDFSDFQALGLTALEAMACGLAVIVPARGGAGTFAKDEENCLVVDTRDQTACFQVVHRLIEDDNLRSNIQANAISTAARFYPEHPTFNILNALFSENP